MRLLCLCITILFFSSLQAAKNDVEPPLPEGLTDTKTEKYSTPVKSSQRKLSTTGFLEGRGGTRLHTDNHEDQASIGELRLQIENQWQTDPATLRLTADFIYDDLENDTDIDLDRGDGWIDLREANVLIHPASFVDVKVGRQILTWGTGDLVFINDLFPKDFVSFFIGRDSEYLKAPSDAARISLFSRAINLDIAYTPRFDADRFVSGERLSYFNNGLGRITGQDAIITPEFPQNDETAIRVFRNFKNFEVAAYFYDGYWKSPVGQTTNGKSFFPELSVWGVSLRGQLKGGILSTELGYYDSRDDPDGGNPLVPNSEWRYLVGYEREVLHEFTVGFQYYAERINDYDAFRKSQPVSSRHDDRTRHVVTARLTKLAFNQNLLLSAFNFWSPNQEDGYLRLNAAYKLTDAWRTEIGSNHFYGNSESSFFGQLKDNSNIFVSMRRSF